MSVKYIELLICDRCGSEFQRRGPNDEWQWLTSYFGIMVLDKGSGSRYNPEREGREWGTARELDKDMCNQCTIEFNEWWKKGKANG